MTISGDILWKLSTQSGAAGNSIASTPAASIGKYMATTQITDATLNNLFPSVTPTEAEAGVTRYRCFFLHNSGASAWLSLKIWMLSQVAGGGTIQLGLDPAGKVAANSGSAQAATPVDELTAPAGVTFSSPVDEASSLSIGDINSGQCQAVWAKMTVPALSAALAADNVVLEIKAAQ